MTRKIPNMKPPLGTSSKPIKLQRFRYIVEKHAKIEVWHKELIGKLELAEVLPT